jgi:NADH-quinone oxidoreductase subunit C
MKTNSFAEGSQFLVDQNAVFERLNDKYMNNTRRLLKDKLAEPVIWATDAKDAKMLAKSFMLDDSMKMDFLSDVTAYDNVDGEDGDKRFVLVYQLYSTINHTRVRIKALLGETENAETITDLWAGANWPEREVFDLFGIKFNGHPNMRRIMMDERFTGFPLRKEYNIKQRQPFSDNVRLHLGGHPLHVDTHLTQEQVDGLEDK